MDKSTNYIIVRSGANIARFIILVDIINPKDNKNYAYCILGRGLKHDGERFTEMSAGLHYATTSEEDLVKDLSNLIIADLSDLYNTNSFEADATIFSLV